MADHRFGILLQHLRRTSSPAPPEDGGLVDQFLAVGDQAAFAALVERHGPMVLGVCRRILDHAEDAEDAFQATFLVLARKAGSIRHRSSLASWLYGVANHLARKVRSGRLLRQAHERKAAPVTEPTTPPTEPTWDDLRPVLDQELGRLPEKYRAPIVLCYLEGRTNDEAAEQLRWRPGTVKSRLARGRNVLRKRLGHRGLVVPTAVLAALMADQALALPVPAALATVTARTASLIVGNSAALAGNGPAVALAQRMMRTLFLRRLTTVLALVVALGLAGGAGWLAAHADPAPPPKDNPPAVAPGPVAADTVFPRRLFAVGVGQSLYTPPTDLGSGNRSAESLVHRLGDVLHVPDRQRSWLSDQAATPILPLKSVVEHNLARFLWSCREQDRAIVVFIGHAVVFDKQAYLVPFDGDPLDRQTLIPLSSIYKRLDLCAARQKVLVLDVCRREPMSTELEEAILAPPLGVQVVTACVAGERSYAAEVGDDAELRGGVMLNQFLEVQRQGDLKDTAQAPEDYIPVGHLTDALRVRTKVLVRERFKKEQTVRAAGEETHKALAYDPKLPAAERLVLEPPVKASRAAQDKAVAICKQIVAQAGLDARDEETLIATARLGLWSEAALDDLRVVQAEKRLRDHLAEVRKVLAAGMDGLPRQFTAPPDGQQAVNTFKDGLVEYSKKAGLMQYQSAELRDQFLSDEYDTAWQRSSTSWQAASDFLQGRLEAHLAYANEYNWALARLRAELPPLDAKIHKGWQLVPADATSDAASRSDVQRARALWEKMATTHRGTPWEFLARREAQRRLGLRWEPLPR
jgi:RNA polymerase sigma factor (sigma-70 family)